MNTIPAPYRFLAAAMFAALTLQSPAGMNTRQTPRPAESPLGQPASANVSRNYGKLPLAFEPNVGQTDALVRFLARGGGMTTFFADTETVMVLGRSEQAVVRMKLEKAGKPRRVVGVDKLPGISNYFIGNDPAKWRTDVPHYARIEYEGVYPGIDMVWYGNQRRLEYDFLVAPGADPNQIQVAYEGVQSLEVAANGDLVLRTALGEVRQQKPQVYQEVGGKQVEVGARYAVVARNRVSFELARYDRKRELRIDPVVLVYSTYLGGSGQDVGQAVAVDAAGAAYVTGNTDSTSFPTQSPYQAANRGRPDVFVTKLTPAGNALSYSTYLGGSGWDQGTGIAVDAAGAAYVTGNTDSTNFPTQSAYQTTYQGGTYDAFVTKLAPAGNALAYSTYLGGSGEDIGRGIALDGAGSAYITGHTESTNFPTLSPYQAKYQGGSGDAFVTKLTPAGNALVYSTYLGGSGEDWGVGIAVDRAGSAYITGDTRSANFPTLSPYQATYQGGFYDAFVTKLTPAGNALSYSTYVGGSGDDSGFMIEVDGAGAAYVTGWTGSTNFPTKSPYQAEFQGGAFDGFVMKLAPTGNALSYSTYLGGSDSDLCSRIAVDGAGSAYVTGRTQSTNFPTQSAYQATYQGGNGDAFVTKLTAAGNALVYSTYLGGSGEDSGLGIALDSAGSAYVTGHTQSTNVPTRSPYQAANAGSYDAFVTKLTDAASPPAPAITSVVNGASFRTGIAAGSWVTVYGTNLANTNPGRTWRPDEIVDGNLPTSLDGVSVTINGKPSYVYYISPTQLNLQAPSDTTQGAVNVVVDNNGSSSVPGAAQLQPFAPAFFQYSGTKYAIVTRHPDYALIGNPSIIPGTVAAKPGDTLIFWGTGFGATIPDVPAGQVVTGAPVATTAPVITVGGLPVTVLATVLSPGSVGLYQIAIQLPASLSSGDLAVQASVGGFQSPAGVNIFVSAN